MTLVLKKHHRSKVAAVAEDKVEVEIVSLKVEVEKDLNEVLNQEDKNLTKPSRLIETAFFMNWL